ncbi:MAG: butyrate kinase [Eubacteriales bacterium]|nr:butyrate kinase [Eubacteriales bacterium]
MNENKKYKILVINPGSTSTKIALFENEECLLETSIFHDAPVLLRFPTANDQLQYRTEVIKNYLKENHVSLTDIDAFVGRGGSSYSVSSGTYAITDKLIEDTKACKGGVDHPANLGVQLAKEFCDEFGGQMFTVDPPDVDELCDLARITGIAGVYHRATMHTLNLKGTARAYAASIGKKYEDCNLIVCHIDGGISVSAHAHGKMVDGNDIAGGDGPFTPTRIGSVSVGDVLNYVQGKDLAEVKKLCTRTGGFVSHFGTSDAKKVHAMVEQGDRKATLVWNAVGYQISKCIGSMAAVLEGKIDAILLGGGLVRYKDLTDQIERRCGWMAPVKIYYEEFEHRSLAAGALRVMRGEEEAKVYTGKPVWNGFAE